MVIGIDIRVLNGSIKSGIEEYTENLLAQMLPLDKSIKYKLFTASFRPISNRYNWLLLPNVEVHKYKIPNKLLFLSANFNLPKVDKLMGGADVFFSPHFFITPLSLGCRRVTTFHDLSFKHYPEFFTLRKNIWHNIEMKPRWQARLSDKLIAVSESTKKDLINLYDIDPMKIKVVYSGISSLMRKFNDEEILVFRSKHKLPGKYILFLGKLEPRKNIISLIRAFNLIKRQQDKYRGKIISNNDNSLEDLHLIIAGSRGWLDDDVIRESNNSPYKDKIIFKDHIIDELRAGYYNCAEIFVYPSFFEGFGFPPLEAMACGTPTIVSATSSLPEICGGCSILVDPTNIDELAISLREILTNKALKSSMVYEGIKKVNQFNWSKSAEETLNYLTK